MLNIELAEKIPHLDSPMLVTSNQVLLVTVSKVIEATYIWIFIF